MKWWVFPLLVSTTGCLTWHEGALPGSPAEATFKEVRGARVHYIDSGTRGTTVVLLHGFGSQLHIWDGLAAELEKTHRVVRLDLKGFGWTDRPEGDYSPQEQAALVWSLLDSLRVERASIVAHSWGSSIALQMALSEPERVRKIALYSAWVYEEQLPSTLQWARAPAVGETIYGLWYDQRTEDKLAMAFYDPRFITQPLVDAVEARMKFPGTKAAALAAVRGQRFAAVQDRYALVAHPTLLVWGREDAISRMWFAERLERQLPNTKLVVYPRCGHFPMIEAAAASNAAVVQFLQTGPVSRK